MSKKLDKLVDEICSEVEKTVGQRKYVETFLQGIDFSRVDEGIIDEDYEYASDGLEDVFYYYEESLNDDEYYEKYGDIFTDKVVNLLNELKKELSKFTESKELTRKSIKEGLIDIKKQIQNYADTNEFDITVQTTPKDELIIAFGGTSDTDKIYNALIKELKSRGADLSTVDIKKKNDIVIGTWNLNLINNGMFDDLIIDGTIDLIDNLNKVVDLHYVF